MLFAWVVISTCSSQYALSQTQTELNLRSASEYRAADAELTAIYGRLGHPSTLIAAERAWIAYRDAECRYEHHATPEGSMYSMEDAMCKTALTRERIALLKKATTETMAINEVDKGKPAEFAGRAGFLTSAAENGADALRMMEASPQGGDGARLCQAGEHVPRARGSRVSVMTQARYVAIAALPLPNYSVPFLTTPSIS